MEPSSTTTTKKRPTDEDATPEMRSDTKRRRRTHKDDEEEQEKEIEEFFAILRRLHVALQYFNKPVSSSSATATTYAAWKPTFEPQDFQDLSDANSGLDLNSEPTFKHHLPSA
ncbi:hypothetical protein K1719_039477 [Acacia pycnantha]|nr:hypothetical protein K1719_039477 [Acacia pycnantha]